MLRRKIWARSSGKGEAVEEEECKDDYDASQDAPPQLLVHVCLDVLLALHEVLHSEVQRVERPDVEGGKGARQG